MTKKQKRERNITLITLILIGTLLVLSPLRYKITGTNGGYVYKTDRLTGKTSIVSPKV